jgi:enoyl-CoA hydratase/carnithine racemase
MNALNSSLMEELGHVFSEISTDNDVKVVIITGQEQFFAAGAYSADFAM